MILTILPQEFSVCKVQDISLVDLNTPFTFTGVTDQEISVVTPSHAICFDCTQREDGFCAFRIEGVLDFSLIGILAKISQILAECEIGIFVISTFNTDYVLVKEENFQTAQKALSLAGYQFSPLKDLS